jgi:hypothetical protein
MADTDDFANPTQARVYRRLARLISAGTARFFRDACRLVAQANGLEATTHMVGHLLREIEGNLLDVLYEQLVEVPPTVTSAPPPDLVQPRTPVLTTSHGEGDGPPDDAAPCGSKDGHKKKVRAILGALGIAPDSAMAQQWISMAGGKKRLHRVAHRDKLNEPRPVNATFLADFNAIVELFDAILEHFEARFGSVYDRLDALLALPGPGADGVSRLEAIPNTPNTLGYFFQRLTPTAWLDPLRRAGFFETPPTPEPAAGGGLTHPYWAAADYLTRVSSAHPKTVADILETAANTENLRAQTQIIALMLQLRPQDRLRLAGVVKRWSPGLRRLFWGDQVVAFAAALARDGAVDLAFDLTASVLDLPELDPRSGRRPVHEPDYGRNQQERTWDLRDAATTLVPALLQADGLRALALFVDALDYHAGRRRHETEADPTTPAGLEDFSQYWGRDLGRRERYDTSDLRLFLTYITLEAVKELGTRNAEQLRGIVEILRQRGARVLRRIELAALAELLQSGEPGVPLVALPIAVDRLTEEALMQEDDLAPEWGALLAAAFPQLDGDRRERVLSALAPPDFSWMDHEHAQSRAAAWRRDRLAIVADHLDSEVREELASLIKAEGPAEPLSRGGPRAATWVGPTSPLDAASLESMDVDSLVNFLLHWEQRPGFGETSQEGLGRQLAKLVEQNPVRYAAWAPRFVGLAPTYVRSLLDGFAAAARAERAFPWTGILELADWVVDQPIPESDMVQSGFDMETDWRGARRTLADLIGLGLAADWNEDGAIPYAERDRLWDLIERLAEDPNPSPAYEERYGGTNMDPHSLAINTTRPEAIDAAIRYALWLASHRAQSSIGLGGVLVTAPQVLRLLEQHLDPAIDPSLATRAAIGTWVGTLARTDPDWVRGQLARLHTTDATERARRDALWDAYVQWSHPHPDALPTLEPYYRAAIERIGADRGTRHMGQGPDDRLAEHILTLYWWGAVSLEDPNSLIAHFFAHADAPRRRHAMYFAGFSLFHTEKPVPAEPVEQLRYLWEWRLPQLESVLATPDQAEDAAGRAAARAELEQFGWWFASRAFDPVWALAQLQKVMGLTGGVEPDFAVAEYLEELSTNHPEEVLRCLAALDFTGGGEPWSAHSWLEHGRAILGDVLAREDDRLREQAKALVNRIVAAGHIEFRSLLGE